MLLNIEQTYKKIKNGLLTDEEKKENKKYFLSIFKTKEIHNYLKFLWKNKDKDSDYLFSFRVVIYCLYNINTMLGEQKLLNKLLKINK